MSSRGNNKPVIQLVGPYPPPQGGISVHTKRLVETIYPTFNVEVLDPYRTTEVAAEWRYYPCGGNPLRRAWTLLRRLTAGRPDVRHFQVSSFKSFASIGGLLPKLNRGSTVTGVTIHSGSFPADFRVASEGGRKRIAELIAEFDFVVAVNQEIADIALCAGVPAERVFVVPAFIPTPYIPNEQSFPDVAELKRGGKKLILASGYGLPLYGYHTLLDSIEISKDFSGSILPILCMYNTYDENYTRSIEVRVKKMGGKVFHNLSPEEFSTVLRRADLFVRPTDRDGDAVSVREALWYSIPVIASDAVPRPKGAILFRTSDSTDLSGKLLGVLDGSLETKPANQGSAYSFDWCDFYCRVIEMGSLRWRSKK